MAKRKAKKKSPSSSSRPSPTCQVLSPPSGPSSPTKKFARNSGLPLLSSSLDLVPPSMKLLGPNWLPEMGSVPLSAVLAVAGAIPSLAAADAVPSPTAVVSGSRQLSPQINASESSLTLSALLAPIDMDSLLDSERSYYSDSSSHYGSPVLATSGLGEDSIESSKLDPLSAPLMLAAAMDSYFAGCFGLDSGPSLLCSGCSSRFECS
ncbi:hypothetical protein OIU77_006156 [Salix suchowensis]|uniref:Uncharacterized protein n=1 Tax=Salix suchowensis TaxID=1278906 RepID=A0ABQ9ARY7_9ROSI|nr:hypothetical protein OIU77_006156 [Salix suchowensis]